MLLAIRELTVTNGASSHDLVSFAADDRHWLWDRTADPTCDSVIEIADQSDASIMDAIRDQGFEIVTKRKTT